MQEWGGVGRSSENFLCCLQHSKFKQHHTFNWLRAKKKAGLLRAIICVKALSTSHCLGGCNFGAELGTNLYMRAEDLSCNSPLRCCDLQLKFHFGIQITWPYCKPKGEKQIEFLDRKFHRIFPKISKISSIYTRKKNPNFFQTFCQERENLSKTTSQVTYNKCFIMVTHHFVSTCQDKAEPFRTMEWWSPYPLCWVRCQASLLSKLYHPWIHPSFHPFIHNDDTAHPLKLHNLHIILPQSFHMDSTPNLYIHTHICLVPMTTTTY